MFSSGPRGVARRGDRAICGCVILLLKQARQYDCGDQALLKELGGGGGGVLSEPRC